MKLELIIEKSMMVADLELEKFKRGKFAKLLGWFCTQNDGKGYKTALKILKQFEVI
ncbi:MAG: hypothetical protein IPL12_21575 [Bacteroidetes bacterium]|nr:hypothetical protein [Bacteroidota bacterium]